MARIPSAIPALALAAALAAACEKAPPPTPAAPAPAAEPANGTDGEILRQRRGWTVTLHRAGDGKPSLCLASRLGAGGANLAFATTATEGRVLLRDAPSGAQPGTVVTLNAVVEGAEPVNLSAILRTDGTLAAVLPFPRFEETVAPLARGSRVTFEGGGMTQTPRPINLTGSAWAINSVVECRILHLTNHGA